MGQHRDSHQQVLSHAAQQNSQQHLFSKTPPRSLLSKPKQKGFKAQRRGRARAAAFPPCQLIPPWHITSLAPLPCFICRLYQEITFTRSVKIMSEYSFITASVVYFASFHHNEFWRDCMFSKWFFNGFCSLLEFCQGGTQSSPRVAQGWHQPKKPNTTHTCNRAAHKPPHHQKNPTAEQHRTPWKVINLALNLFYIPAPFPIIGA